MEKVRYEVDPFNRLVLNKSSKLGDLTKFRKVVDGRFRVDRNNDLTYHVKAPFSKKENIPHKVRLKGTWRITPEHDLSLTLDKEGTRTLRDKIILKGKILDVKKNSLLFAVTTKRKDNSLLKYTLNLSGVWKADRNNRLTFCAKREKGKHDILTLTGAWEINKTHQVVYSYKKSALTRKRKELHTLAFKGYWSILDKNRIAYSLSKSSDSAFEFKTSAARMTGNMIKCRIGVSLAGREKPLERILKLKGEWRPVKNLGLAFEVKEKNKKLYAMTFGADARVTKEGNVSFRLKSDMEKKDT
ncbi:hypothetical protein ACFL4E_03670, partial [Candidatus Omnitrophota bacterium]